MKVSIKIKDLLEQYVAETDSGGIHFKPTFLCNFIKTTFVIPAFRGSFDHTKCEAALVEMFSRYFQKTEHSKFCSTISGWFVFNFEDAAKPESSQYIQLIDSTQIPFSGERAHRNNLRTFMMQHVVKMNPDEIIAFEISMD